ncbi:beta strand repeat-containing protein [Paraburkholderia bannensis]|uniref:beta strand repeat-containing protein n=1 Tax=Paraburkholderia bannensis TaxID=765414 RepID=UPI002AB73D20|nr:S-layer family protein [Paraburkholderia bannensis]
MSEITAGIFFSNLFGAATSAANAGTNPTDVRGTVVGIGQAVQGGVSLIAGNIDAIAKPMGWAGAALSATGLAGNVQSIRVDIASGKAPTLSDLSGAIGNTAAFAGSALVIFGVGETLLIPLAVVGGVAGTVQLVASSTGWRVDVNGIASAVTLTANQWAQAASQLEVANSNPNLIASALSSAGINTNAPNSFLVPLTDSSGNVVGFQPETPIGSKDLGSGITQYTFSGGTTFQQQASSYVDPKTGQTDIVVYPLANWTMTASNGTLTTLNITSGGGYSGTITNSHGVVTQQTGLQVSGNTANGITTTTQTITSNLGGSQSKVQNQVSSNGNTASKITTVYNSDGSISYTENKASTSGTVTSDVVNANVNASLAIQGDNVVLNGVAGNIVAVYGRNDSLNASSAQFSISSGGLSSTISGNNNTINADANSITALYGTGSIVNFAQNSGAIVRLYNANSSATVNGAGNTIGIWATGDSVTASGETFNFATGGFSINIAGGSNSVNENVGMSVSATGGGNTINAAAGTMTSVSGTNGNADQINANGLSFGGTSANGQGAGIWLGANTQVNLTGSGNGLGENAGDSVSVIGGGNTINAAAGTMTSVSGTNGNADQINANGLSFGGTSANGLGTGIWLGANTQVNLTGSGNGLGENAGDSVSVIGGGNTINAAAGTMTSVSGTNGNADQINANGLSFGGASANGQGTGIWLGANTQVNLTGSGNGLGENAGDSVSVIGGGNTINAAAGTMTSVSGTNGNADQINANGLSFGITSAIGQGTGIWLGANTKVNLTGSNNGLSENAGDIVNANGNSNTINAAANTTTTLYGSADTVNSNGSGSQLSIGGNGQNASTANIDNVNFASGASGTVNESANSRVDVSGNGITVNAGANDSTGVYGSAETVNVTGNGSAVYTGNNGQNASTANMDHVNFAGGVTGSVVATSNSRVDTSGDGITVNAAANDLMGVYGSAEMVNVTGNGSSIYTGNNGQNASNANDNHVNLAGGITGSVNVTDNSHADVSGSGVTLNVGSNSLVGIAGDQNNVNVAGGNDNLWVTGAHNMVTQYNGSLTLNGNGASTNLAGGNDNVNLLSSGDFLGLNNGTGYNVTAQGSTINTSANVAFTVTGNNNAVSLSNNSAVAVNGTGNTINAASNSVILDNGVNNTINATNDVVQIGPQNAGKTVYVLGNGNQIDASSLLWQGAYAPQTTIVVRGTGNTIYGSPGALIVDLNDTHGNTVCGSSIAVTTNNANSFTRVGTTTLPGEYGPLNPNGPTNSGIYFPSYDPGVGGTGGSFSNGGFWEGNPVFAGLGQYMLPVADNGCGGSSYNADGELNVMVCGAGAGGGFEAVPPLLQTTATSGQSQAAGTSTTTPGSSTSVPHPALPDISADSLNIANAPRTANDPSTIDTAVQDQDFLPPAASPTTADSADLAVQSLISALASFGADSSASSTFSTPAQNDPIMQLAASSY